MIQNPNIQTLDITKSNVTKEHFEKVKLLGKGGQGKVQLVQCKIDGKFQAMKALNKELVRKNKHEKQAQLEKEIMQFHDHPFIIKLYYAFQTSNKLYMVMHFCEGGEIFYHIKANQKLPENRAKFYAAQVVLVLEQLHFNEILYRDLKPENLMIDSDGQCKITDFGLSKCEFSAQVHDNKQVGTPEYFAPEIILRKGHSFQVDYWALGCLIYEMTVGIPPFVSSKKERLFQKILSFEISWPRWLSPECKNVILGLLTLDPAKRLGCRKGGIEELKHDPWFKEINFNKLYKRQITSPQVPNSKELGENKQFEQDCINAETFESYSENVHIKHYSDWSYDINNEVKEESFNDTHIQSGYNNADSFNNSYSQNKDF